MKIAFPALVLATLLLPAASFARDDYRGSARQSSAQENFVRNHPRRPSSYCHRHQFPEHRDDKRRHCHNWENESWRDAYLALGNGSDGWRRDSRRDGPWDRDRLGVDQDRRRGWWGRSLD
jgi:hypothetical protein